MASEIEHMQADRKRFRMEEPRAEYVLLAAATISRVGLDRKDAIEAAFDMFDMIQKISWKRVELKCEIEAKRRKGY